MASNGHPADFTPLFAPPNTPVYLYNDSSPPLAHPDDFFAADEALATDLLRELDPVLAASSEPSPPLSVASTTSAVNTGSLPMTEGEAPHARIIHHPPRPMKKKRRGGRVQKPIPRKERTYRKCSRCGVRNHNRRLCCTACYLPRAAM